MLLFFFLLWTLRFQGQWFHYTQMITELEFLKLNQTERSLHSPSYVKILRVIGKFKLKKFTSQRIYPHRRCIIDKKKSDRSFESLIRQSFARRPIGRGEIDANN